MLKLHHFTVCSVCLLYQVCQSDILTSTAHLEDVSKTEENLSTLLERFIKSEKERIDFLKSLLLKRKRFITRIRKFVKSDSMHSLATAAYLWSFTDDWGWILPIVNSSASTLVRKADLLRSLKDARSVFPPQKDFEGSQKAVLRLQQVYTLSAADLVKGHVVYSGKRYSAVENMSAVDAFSIGKFAYNRGFWRHTKEWMENAVRLMQNHRVVKTIATRVELREVLHYLAFVEYKLGHWQQSLQTYKRVKELDPQNTHILESIERLEKEMKTSDPYADKEKMSEFLPEDVYIDFASLCKESRPRKRTDFTKELKCWYHNKNPALLLKPVAMEMLNNEPQIFMFHNFTSDKENDELIKLATPLLERATVNNRKTGELQPAEYRISKSAWFMDEEAEIVRQISKRIEMVTGLSIETSEDLQMNNYGLGGHYEPHYDQSRDMSISPLAKFGVGNRIATFMIYLSEVEAGGATAFLKPGLRIAPKKGSGIFWYNLLRSGESDWRTFHAGCPVLVGNKWVANKWLHERGQEFLRPCGLVPDKM